MPKTRRTAIFPENGRIRILSAFRVKTKKFQFVTLKLEQSRKTSDLTNHNPLHESRPARRSWACAEILGLFLCPA